MNVSEELNALETESFVEKKRCAWPRTDIDGLYHDEEWGFPITDDRLLFEHFSLSGAQAGLSWLTVLKRRAGYRAAFCDFDAARVAAFGEPEIAELLTNTGIIRNRQKIQSVITNARAIVSLQETHGSFAKYLWAFVEGRPVVRTLENKDLIQATSPLSDTVSAALKKAGFSFAGSTIVYAVLQSVGIINDHHLNCYRHAEILSYTENNAPFGQ